MESKYIIGDGSDPLGLNSSKVKTKKVDKNALQFEESLNNSKRSLVGSGVRFDEAPILFTSNTSHIQKPRYPFGKPQNEKSLTEESTTDISPMFSKSQISNDDYGSFFKPSENEARLEDLGFQASEIISGEKCLTHYPALVTTPQYPMVGIDGILVVTKFRVAFFPSDPDFLKKRNLRPDFFILPLAFIYKIDRVSVGDKKGLFFLEIFSKDGRQFKFRITEKKTNDAQSFFFMIDKYVFISSMNKDLFFANEYGKFNKTLDEIYGGWNVYDIKKEFERQGLKIAPEGSSSQNFDYPYRYVDNRTFKICSTYPQLLAVPSRVSDVMIIGSSKFRTKERVPTITYYHAATNAILTRSSQCKSGLTQNRSVDDELLLRLIGNPNYTPALDTTNNNILKDKADITVHIYDARPYLNAVANRVNGKGYEEPKFYKNSEIFFMDIGNIHHVRDCHKKLLNMCYSSETNSSKWLSNLESTGWLQVIAYILNAAISVVNSILIGKSTLVHCSDGWDRASQIVALAQLLLDPYYRTIEGFQVLIEKDFVSFGHQFALRMGHGVRYDKDDQRSPVFLQFLDCVYQIYNQYPYAFEFNKTYLSDIAYHSYSCQFGNFLCSTYQEQLEYKIREKTISLWSYINSQKEKYMNIYYTPMKDINPKKLQNSGLKDTDPDNIKNLLEESIHQNIGKENAPIMLENLSTEAYLIEISKLYPDVLRPSLAMKRLRLWEEYYLYYSPLSLPLGLMKDHALFNEDMKEYLLLKKIKELKKQLGELKELNNIHEDNSSSLVKTSQPTE